MRRVQTIVAAATAAGFAFAPAMAQDRGPEWLRKPSAQDLYSVWPTAAWQRGEGGKAMLSCVVTTVGTLRECLVTSETPPGSGFGVAALAISPQFLMKPAMKNGQPVVGHVSIPILFEAPGKALGSLVAGPEAGPTLRIFRNMPWLEAPTVADVQAADPPKAKAGKTTGFATLQCKLRKDGRLGNCDTLTEEPKGYGFGAAARGLSAKFRGPSTDSAGKSVEGGVVQLRFTFAPETLDAASPLIGKPDWTAMPAATDFVAPEAAVKAGVLKARVVMTCTVAADGGLTNCSTLTEEPAGYGYAAAMLKLAPGFRLSLWSTEGLPTIGGRVDVPIRFDFTAPPPPAKP